MLLEALTTVSLNCSDHSKRIQDSKYTVEERNPRNDRLYLLDYFMDSYKLVFQLAGSQETYF